MNKKFNLLALAAAASACGALVLTSCGGSAGHKVIFWTNGDLRNSETGKVITVPTQTVAHAKQAKAPNLQDLQRKKAVRWTWKETDKNPEAEEVKYWSYDNEDQPKEFKFTRTPITKDTILYPVYVPDEEILCVTLEPVDREGHIGTWLKDGQESAHVYDDNYFVKGVNLEKFGSLATTAILKAPKGLYFSNWYKEGDEPSVKFTFDVAIDDDVVLIANYTTTPPQN